MQRILTLTILAALVVCGAPALAQQGTHQLAAVAPAAAAGQYHFYYFFKERTPQSEQLWQTFQAAMAEAGAQQVQFSAVDANDPQQAQTVAAYKLERAPMPLALAVAPNGAVMGAFPNTFTKEQLLGAIGTPTQATVVKAFQDNKLVLLCVQNETTKMNVPAMQGVQAFKSDPMLGPYTEIVHLNPAQPTEAKFLQQMQIPQNLDTATTYLITPPGVTAGMWSGATEKTAILSTLTTKGCGPNCECLKGQQADNSGVFKKFFKNIASAR
jgi:hypothetical protein